MKFTPNEQKILNRIQRDIPFTEFPFGSMADETGIPAGEFLETVRKLKSEGVVRNISGIFNASSLGYKSCLAALAVDAERTERAAAIISSHPGVSHNYLRGHWFNIWFTLALPEEKSLNDAVRDIAEGAGAAEHIIFRTVKLFKIGVHFAIGDEGEDSVFSGAPSRAFAPAESRRLTIGEKEAVRLLQFDLPLEERPFRSLLTLRGGRINETMLLDLGNSFKEKGMMRRYSAVLRHRKAGYSANAMTVWNPGALDEDGIARTFGAVRNISHLYLRDAAPGKWDHPLFAMVHAKSDEELDGIIESLKKDSGIGDCLVLKTLREFKKERVIYFSPEFEEWETGKWKKKND